MAKSLGKLKRANLKDFWGEEFDKFSSWLIQEEILEMIGEAIAIELAPANDDILVRGLSGGAVAKNVKDDTYVLIQGQLAGITSSDFGKLIMQAAGIDATAVIWIASHIPEEHRKTLDWLNDVSRDDIRFYGAELELWRIDDSAPAPNFSLVCQPNQWARNLKPVQDDRETVKSIEAESEAPLHNKDVAPQRKGDWTKKASEALTSSPQGKPSAQEKDDVAVRENFVYTKSF